MSSKGWGILRKQNKVKIEECEGKKGIKNSKAQSYLRMKVQKTNDTWIVSFVHLHI